MNDGAQTIGKLMIKLGHDVALMAWETLMIVSSNNMSPSIKAGAIVAVDFSREAREIYIDGEIYVIGYDDPNLPPMLYRFCSTGVDTVKLKSDNMSHPSYDMQKAEIMPKVIGRVRWVIQRYY